ncbi:MAG: CRISPR-associated endonuclease Cas2 [Parcubacteria group bacterium]|nr:CRISPR-associated endonuclease Cas2 [Parcubacteria group bacterium]
MKLPITDQFLWSVYKFFEVAGDVLEPSEIFKLKTFSQISPLGREYWKNIERKKQKKQFAQFINYLKKNGYIKIEALKEKQGILLTKKGEQKALKADLVFTDQKKRKDKKWIMVMYDIPEKKKKQRTRLRQILQLLGYKCLQKSIWVCPYDVFKKTERMISSYSLDPYVRIFLIEEITW